VLEESVVDFPVCLDSDFLAHLVQTLGRLRGLEGTAPAAKGGASSGSMQAAKALLLDVLASLDQAAACGERWAPVLESFSELKAELREPIILVVRDWQRAEGAAAAAGKGAASADSQHQAQQRHRDAWASGLKDLMRVDGAVRRALALEQQIEVLLTMMNTDLGPFADFAAAVLAETNGGGAGLEVRKLA